LAQSVFKGEARLRELEHLADTARKVRDQAAAELTRGSGATHHIARDRIGAAERMLRKSQLEIAELRAQLAIPGDMSAATTSAIAPQDLELAIMLGHNKGRFNQVGGEHAPLELQQDTRLGRHRVTVTAQTRQHSQANLATDSARDKRHRAISLVLLIGLMIGALGTAAMLNLKFVDEAAQIVREGTEQLFMHIYTLLPTSDASSHATRKTAFSKPDNGPHGKSI
jgi:hypothetical protein